MRTKPKRAGAPKKSPDKVRDVLMQFRVAALERDAFQAAAELDGKTISEWFRDRLRGLARTELEQAGLPVPFVQKNEKTS